jgi:hypothetical protein
MLRFKASDCRRAHDRFGGCSGGGSGRSSRLALRIGSLRGYLSTFLFADINEGSDDEWLASL